MTTPIKIAELQMLDAAAAPGPWVHLVMKDALHDWPNGERQRRVCRTSPMQSVYAPDEGHDRGVSNAEAIAAMRNALPALLRLAVATHRRRHAQLKSRGTHEDAIACTDADAEEREALAALDFANEEPSA